MEIGSKVTIETVSPMSYQLYQHYKKKVPIIVCPCTYKNKTVALTVEDIIGKALILSFGDFMTICLEEDCKEIN